MMPRACNLPPTLVSPWLRRSLRVLAALPLLLLLTAPGQGRDVPLLWGSLTPGPYDVGFRLLERSDASRPLSDGSPRPLQVGLWYPASVGDAAPFPYRRYLELLAGETRFAGVTEAEREQTIETYLDRVVHSGVSRDACNAWLETATGAVWDAAPASGRFPRVLLAQGNDHSLHHLSVLAEYLASQGFLVASTPSQGRITSPPSSLEEVLPRAEEQASDLAFVEGLTRDLPESDGSGAAVLGFSFGGRAAFLDAMAHPERAALVSLDGGMANALGKGELEKAAFFDAPSFAVPILHLYQRGDPVVQPDFDLLEKLQHSERFLAELPGMRHGLFSSFGMVASRIPGFAAMLPEGQSVQATWECMARMVLDFLDLTLRAETRAPSLPQPAWDAFKKQLEAAHQAGTIVEWRHLHASAPARNR